VGATLILVNGQSASGKTALAGWLSEQLGVTVISKDFFKEQMYDERLPRDRAESQEYGRRAYDLAFGAAEKTLREGRSVILEAPMQREHSQGQIEGLINATGAGVVQVLLVADREALRARYIERQQSGERHSGHEVGLTEEWLAGAFVDSFPALEIERTFEVETTDFASVDREAVLSRLRGWLGAGSDGAV
jgi:predicted kinase